MAKSGQDIRDKSARRLTAMTVTSIIKQALKLYLEIASICCQNFFVNLPSVKSNNRNFIPMSTWFECKVRYDKIQENGSVKKANEPYLVDALSFTEAEARIIEEVTPSISGDFSVSAVKRTNFTEIFWDHTADKWYHKYYVRQRYNKKDCCREEDYLPYPCCRQRLPWRS